MHENFMTLESLFNSDSCNGDGNNEIYLCRLKFSGWCHMAIQQTDVQAMPTQIGETEAVVGRTC